MSPPKLPEVPKSKWKPRHHIGIYEYNYQVGESYYKPQTKYIHNRPVEANTSEKPPESRTYAERFASDPIYGTARGLPYAESESVFRQPDALKTVGSRSRAASLSRDSGVSQYLSSLGSGSAFNRADSRLSRQLAEPQAGKPSVHYPSTASDPRRVTSLPPIKKRSEDYKDFGTTKTYPLLRTSNYNNSSLGDISSMRRPSFAEKSRTSEPLASSLSRRSSLGSQERSASVERKVKDELSSLCYGPNIRDEGPRYRSSQYFRDARRQQESADINRMVDRLKHTGWGSSRSSRTRFRS